MTIFNFFKKRDLFTVTRDEFFKRNKNLTFFITRFGRLILCAKDKNAIEFIKEYFRKVEEITADEAYCRCGDELYTIHCNKSGHWHSVHYNIRG